MIYVFIKNIIYYISFLLKLSHILVHIPFLVSSFCIGIFYLGGIIFSLHSSTILQLAESKEMNVFNTLFEYINKLQELHLSENELSLLSAMALLNPG